MKIKKFWRLAKKPLEYPRHREKERKERWNDHSQKKRAGARD